jgi:hypothetical protein
MHPAYEHPLCKHPAYKHPLCKHPLHKHPACKHPACKHPVRSISYVCNYLVISYLMQEDRAVDRPVFLGTAF